ncbi:transcriptional regulator GcvA [Salinarimonas soli]|uniref:Transcriptional regulator GcvA n=2 Tax=Salinarimonas soli TaxID=1638099 RepID=A0A5B2V8T3_9HYPH|nr:transcriptional regulator GcvA [Salinarimonas soli]
MAQSRRRLPPLNAVRAFEAAARHLSFQKAADELAVTPSAVAQQVKGLEEHLGQAMFRRLPSKGVVLTDAGQLYAAALRPLFDELAIATAEAARPASSSTLTVSTVPSFASRWLIPRLAGFRRRRPDLEVRVLASMGLTDFAREGVDVAVRLGRGGYPGMRTDLLMAESFFPVCSPSLLSDAGAPLRSPVDLRFCTLLHEERDPGIPEYVDWRRWLTEVGADNVVDATRGPRFSHMFLALQAAISGQGVALATSALIGDDLVAGRLIRPFRQEVEGIYRYWVVSPESGSSTRNVAGFREWLLEEAVA